MSYVNIKCPHCGKADCKFWVLAPGGVTRDEMPMEELTYDEAIEISKRWVRCAECNSEVSLVAVFKVYPAVRYTHINTHL